MLVILMILLTSKWSAQGQSTPHFDMVVAQDGSGDFSTITDAVNATPNHSSKRIYIRIKSGIYNENVIIGEDKTNLAFIGDGMDKTIISGNKSYTEGFKTYQTATVGIKGDGFVAQDITIQNTAGPEADQAVALRSQSNYSVYFRCKVTGYQDTLYAKRGIQFFRECEIFGTVDFIFGDAKVVFQNCNIYGRQPLERQSITITAQNRGSSTEKSGTIIHNCTVSVTPDLGSSDFPVKMYLGRPWGNYSTTIFMQSFLDGHINPEGWKDWAGRSTLDTIYYAEYDNRGPGANTSGRVNWKGCKVLSSSEASQFTVRTFINGDAWLPSIGVPYQPDLI